jgi:hypothetical protein
MSTEGRKEGELLTSMLLQPLPQRWHAYRPEMPQTTLCSSWPRDDRPRKAWKRCT